MVSTTEAFFTAKIDAELKEGGPAGLHETGLDDGVFGGFLVAVLLHEDVGGAVDTSLHPFTII